MYHKRIDRDWHRWYTAACGELGDDTNCFYAWKYVDCPKCLEMRGYKTEHIRALRNKKSQSQHTTKQNHHAE